MDTKKIVPAITLVALGGVWLVMTAKGQQPPAALSQAIVAAAGTLFAGAAIPTKSKEVPNEKA